MKAPFLARQIPPRRHCKFNDKSTDVLLHFRPADENASHLLRRWSLAPKSLLLVLLYCFLLISCNGGGGGSTVAGGGIDGTGIMSAGVISAFGSVVVNGTEFDTSKAAIIINGEEVGVGDDAVLENLDLGKVVTVEGRTSKDGTRITADRVLYNDNVTGPVESVSGIDPITNEKEIVVLGQIVVVNFITKFTETTFDTIAPGDVVEVSGYVDDTGAVRATFLEKKITSILEYEVTGFVDNLDTDLKTFMINGLEVDYSSIANNLPPGIPAEDLFVELAGGLAAGGEMLATKIELGDELDGEDGDNFEIMGYVTEIISNTDIIEFKVGNQVVHVDPEMVVFVDGTPGDIVPGVKLEAEGSLDGGILFADEIEFWKPDQIEVEGLVTNIVSASEFNIGIQKVQTNQDTIFEGGDRDDLALGVRLEVKGVPVDLNHHLLIADKVSFETD
jgi:hypothetical protein